LFTQIELVELLIINFYSINQVNHVMIHFFLNWIQIQKLSEVCSFSFFVWMSTTG
jgi:hypothetical protein